MSDIYVDHNVARNVAAHLDRFGHAVTLTGRLGLARVTDDEQLLTAAQRRAVLLTHDKEDFKLLHNAWRRWSSTWGVAPKHAGIVIPPQDWEHERIAEVVDALLRSGAPMANELYVWRPQIGWDRQP